MVDSKKKAAASKSGAIELSPVAGSSISPSPTPDPPVHSQFAFYLIHANMVFYAFFWWLNQPVLPYLSKELGANNLQFGYFQSFTQLVQLIGTPIIGRLIDLRGARFALCLSHACACLSYILLWSCNTLPLLFASQIPTVAMAAMHASQAYITLLSTQQERAKQIGRISLSYGIGFLLGPTVGGTLSKYIGYQNIAGIGAVGSALVAVVLVTLLPDAKAHDKKETAAVDVSAADDNKKPTNWLAALELLKAASIRDIILVKLFLGLSLAVYRTTFQIVAKDDFGLDAQQNGFILSGVGGLTMAVNVFVVGFLTSRFTEYSILTYCVGAVSASLLVSAFAAQSLEAILVALVPMSVAGAVAATILTSRLTKSCSLSDAGSVLGLDMSIGTASRVVAPTLGGYLLTSAGFTTVAAACAVCGAVASAFVFAMHGDKRDNTKQPKKVE